MKGAVPYMAMVIGVFGQVGSLIASKAATSSGMNNFAFVFYSNAIAFLILLPSSFLIHRSGRPPLTSSLLSAFFLLGFLGFSMQVIGYTGVKYVPASFISAMMNLIPGFTFVLAIIFRMEKMECGSSSTLAKFLGTVVTISGAIIVTLYKGHQILMTPSSSKLNSASSNNLHTIFTPQYSFLIGGLIYTIVCAIASTFTITQALIVRKYPAELIILLFYCFSVAFLCGVFSLIVERDFSAWSLHSTTRLIAVIYSGTFGSAFQIGIGTWCMHRKGPFFVAMFQPLGIVIGAAMGIIFLGEPLYLGSLVGSIIIAVGFYSVMWGKAKEGKMVEEISGRGLGTTSQEAPLLENHV